MPEATLVTVSTPALLPVYAAHGRGQVLYNYLPSLYDGLPRTDSDVIGWPGSYHSHPNDPEVVGGAIARLVGEGARFVMRGDPTGAGRAFGLAQDRKAAACRSQVAEGGRRAGYRNAPLADTGSTAPKAG
jgi:hypothetical protein